MESKPGRSYVGAVLGAWWRLHSYVFHLHIAVTRTCEMWRLGWIAKSTEFLAMTGRPSSTLQTAARPRSPMAVRKSLHLASFLPTTWGDSACFKNAHLKKSKKRFMYVTSYDIGPYCLKKFKWTQNVRLYGEGKKKSAQADGDIL